MAIPEQGFAFPFRIDAATGGVARSAGAEKIRQNIRVLLGTRPGERPMLRDYGSHLHALVHDPNDDVTADLVQTQTQHALLQWEPRVMVTSARVERDGGELRLRIDYVHNEEPVTGQLLVPIR